METRSEQAEERENWVYSKMADSRFAVLNENEISYVLKLVKSAITSNCELVPKSDSGPVVLVRVFLLWIRVQARQNDVQV